MVERRLPQGLKEIYHYLASGAVKGVGKATARLLVEEFGEDVLSTGREEGKYQLDLWRANEKVLLDAGLTGAQISVTDICTCCNEDKLFSHRASKGKRGNLGAFLSLRE